jgi:signal transduction histidine kinase/ligand-binding sensor domain-containing protein
MFFRSANWLPRLLAVLVSAEVALCPLVFAGDGGQDFYRFKRIGVSADLTPNVITKLYFDRKNLLWVGTREGLFLYDGYSTQRFVNNPDDPRSISDNSIRSVFQDRSGRMWFGTNTGGLCSTEPERPGFSCYRANAADPGSISHDSVYVVVQDDEGFLWVGTQEGLNRIEPESGRIERVSFDDTHPEGPGREYVTALHFDGAGDLWVGTVGRGLFVRRRGKDHFQRLDGRSEYSDASGFSFLEDGEGNLWAGGENAVLVKREGSERFEVISLMDFSKEDNVPISVTAMVLTDEGKILAGSFSSGLFEIDPVDFGVVHHRRMPSDPYSLGDERITDIVIDPSDGILLGTWGAGLQRTTPASRLFDGIEQFIDSKGVLTRLTDVESVAADNENEIWAGSTTHGLLKLENGTDGPELYSIPLDDLERPTAVVKVFPERTGTVWVGTVSGIIELDSRSHSFRQPSDKSAGVGSIGSGWVTAMIRDGNGALWIGTGGSGLWRFTPDGRTIGFVNDPSDPTSLSGDYVTTLALDDFGQVLVGTRSHGFSRCTVTEFRCRQFDPAKGASLRHHYVTAFARDRNDVWWIGTAGGGLHRVIQAADGSVEGFEYLDEDWGLLDNTVMSFVEDDDGSLWMGTRRGLARLSPDRKSVANYLPNDGLVSDVFNRGAAVRDRERLYFGTVSGIAHIPAGTPFRPSMPAPLLFTHVHNLTIAKNLGGPGWTEPAITSNHGDVLQIGFALLDYEGGNHTYAYRLRDDADWIGLESSHQITFGDLSPGRHALQVRARSARGAVSVATLLINVVPPFWMTTWFRLLVALGIVLLALGMHSLRTAGLQRRNIELQSLHDARERALRKLQLSESELSEAAQGLRRLASRLETAKEEERQHISRELHDELGQSLTAAKISLQMLKNSDSVPKERLQSAVDMMDRMIRQVRAISLNLRPALLDDAGLVPALASELKNVSAQTGVPVELDVIGEIPPLSEAVGTVAFRTCQEAVSNSLRHSGASRVCVSLMLQDDTLVLVIEDDGYGFDVDEARKRAMRGEHLGLLGLDERVNSVGGTVRLESEPQAGTMLKIRIPLGH